MSSRHEDACGRRVWDGTTMSEMFRGPPGRDLSEIKAQRDRAASGSPGRAMSEAGPA